MILMELITTSISTFNLEVNTNPACWSPPMKSQFKCFSRLKLLVTCPKFSHFQPTYISGKRYIHQNYEINIQPCGISKKIMQEKMGYIQYRLIKEGHHQTVYIPKLTVNRTLIRLPHALVLRLPVFEGNLLEIHRSLQ